MARARKNTANQTAADKKNTEATTEATTEDKQRSRATLAQFLEVIESSQTSEEAAVKLGLTLGSFTQRLRRERKRYPHLPIDWTRFVGRVGQKVPEENEAMALLAQLRGVSVEELQKQQEAEAESAS